MRQTAKAYIASLEQIAKNNGIADLRTQINIWPYPQSRQSHIAIWRQSCKNESSSLPSNAIRIPLDSGDCSSPGATVHVAEDAPGPKTIALQISKDGVKNA